MALVKFGGGVVQMTGSIAGNTFARNRYGNYVRAKTTPVQPNTALQTAVRSAMAFLTARWSDTLTAGQRTAWNLYGASVNMTNRLGETVNLSGFNHYIRSNIIRKQKNAAVVDNGPTTFEIPEADPTFSVSASEATQDITAVYDAGLAWADENGAFLFLFAGQPQNAQRNFFDGPWRWYDSVAGVNGAPPASPAVGGSSYAITELQRIFTYARISRADGRLSAKFRADAFCGA